MECETRPVFGPLKVEQRAARPGLGKATTAWIAARAALAGQGQVHVVWGVWGTSGLVAGGQESRESGSCRETGSSQRTSTRLYYTRHDPSSRGFRPPATNRTAPRPPRAICTWHHTAIDALPALRMVAPLTVRFQRPENGPCFAIHPSGFPCACAGSDGCPVFIRETSPVKSCGLYTDAALRGRLVPLEEVHLAEIQA